MSRRFELLGLLEAYAPSAAEQRAHAEMLDLISGPGDPFSKYRYEPGHFTVGCYVLSRDRSSVALVHHRRIGTWLEPGGHVDPDDPSVVAAGLRELREETGLASVVRLGEGLLDVDSHPIPSHRAEPHHRHLNLSFAFVAAGDETLQHDPAESHDARWQPVTQVAELTEDAAVRRAVGKLRRLAG
jgi:8-oxo-dGTP pyrophosphatase MutT (NUDIX family)